MRHSDLLEVVKQKQDSKLKLLLPERNGGNGTLPPPSPSPCPLRPPESCTARRGWVDCSPVTPAESLAVMHTRPGMQRRELAEVMSCCWYFRSVCLNQTGRLCFGGF